MSPSKPKSFSSLSAAADVVLGPEATPTVTRIRPASYYTARGASARIAGYIDAPESAPRETVESALRATLSDVYVSAEKNDRSLYWACVLLHKLGPPDGTTIAEYRENEIGIGASMYNDYLKIYRYAELANAYTEPGSFLSTGEAKHICNQAKKLGAEGTSGKLLLPLVQLVLTERENGTLAGKRLKLIQQKGDIAAKEALDAADALKKLANDAADAKSVEARARKLADDARVTAEKGGEDNKAALDRVREDALVQARQTIAASDQARADAKATKDADAATAEREKPESERPGFNSLSETAKQELIVAACMWNQTIAEAKISALLFYRQSGKTYDAATIEAEMREVFQTSHPEESKRVDFRSIMRV